jgi:hypothetical protein
MENRRPVGWADVLTKRDLDAFEQRMNLRFDALGRRFEIFGHEDSASPSGELLTAAVRAQTDLIRGRTRTLIMANIITVIVVTALLFGIGILT